MKPALTWDDVDYINECAEMVESFFIEGGARSGAKKHGDRLREIGDRVAALLPPRTPTDAQEGA